MKKLICLLLFVGLAAAAAEWADGQIILTIRPETKGSLESGLKETWIGMARVPAGRITGIQELDELNARYDLKRISRLIVGEMADDARAAGLDRFYLVEFYGKPDVLSLCAKYEALACVEEALPNYKMAVDLVPDDSLYGSDYWTETWHLWRIEAEPAWDITTGDGSVVVGPIDTGVEWCHPDIEPKLWVNDGEDLNGNGVFDNPDDLNGTDDDGNGLVDDIIGFDYVSYDWDPYPHEAGNHHGTHVYGLACGATNNEIGISSIGWDVKGIAFKCGDDEYVYMNAAVNAIYYAANNGAVATNHSYGGSYHTAERTAMIFAHDDRDVTVCTSAGNDDNPNAGYPGMYPGVVGVAATNLIDEKASFSCYGDSVDVASPGVQILSTLPDTSYGHLDGTSMSSPIVCGLAGMIRSLQPSYSSWDTDSTLFWGCENIDHLNPGCSMGWGRINAWRSLALTISPYLEVTEYEFDGDGRPEPDETVTVTGKLTNWKYWQDASDVTVKLHALDPMIQMTDSTVEFSCVLSGETLDIETADPFEFHVQAGCTPRFVDFVLDYESTPQSGNVSDTFVVLVGYPSIVLVDDADDSLLTPWYIGTLDTLGLPYEYMNADDDVIRGLLDHDRDIAIWFTGDDSSDALSNQEIDSLEAFLDGGGNLLISSQFLGEDPDAATFMSDYLKAEFVESTSYKVMRGYDGDTLGNEFYLKLYGTGGAANTRSADKVNALSGADTCFYYTNMNGTGDNGPGAVRYECATYKSVYLAFPFEAIADAADRTWKHEVMHRILEWFGVTSALEEDGPRVDRPLGNRFSVRPTVWTDGLDIRLELAQASPVTITLYNAAGGKVKDVFTGHKTAGIHHFSLDRLSLARGVYFARISTPSFARSVKLVKVLR
jgi:hypothetical protein